MHRLYSKTPPPSAIYRLPSLHVRLQSTKVPKKPKTLQGPKNQVGVQLLSPAIHSQVFKNTSFPPPDDNFVNISREHLAQHGLDTSQASDLPPIAFDLPPLLGDNLDRHFHRIGAATAEPHLSLAKEFGGINRTALPSLPESWIHQSGWTKYHPDGSFESIDSPGEESMLCFDVETLPNYHNYAIMACAMSPTAWYTWLSPWLLGETEDPAQLIPLGDPSHPRVVVGHNVAYDRARVREEYSLERSANRWLDTMALHVATKGISSHQRASWITRRKEKKQAQEQKEEVIDTVKELMEQAEADEAGEVDEDRRADLQRQRLELEDGIGELASATLEDEADIANKRWEDITAVNSLAEVAHLHCGIEIDKTIRGDFMTATPESVREKLDEYITYCATDVATTHAVFSQLHPAFLEACPSPVSWAGFVSMGNGFLPVNETWEQYIQSAEGTYRQLEERISSKLEALAIQAKDLFQEPEKWENDEWLSQLDWSPKNPGRSRGVEPPPSKAQLQKAAKASVTLSPGDTRQSVPQWYVDLIKNPVAPKNLERLVPLVLRMEWKGYPLFWSLNHGWVYRAPESDGEVVKLQDGDGLLNHSKDGEFFRLQKRKVRTVLGPALVREGGDMKTRDIQHWDLVQQLVAGSKDEATQKAIVEAADAVVAEGLSPADPWLEQLDWTDVPAVQKVPQTEAAPVTAWPKWYWELTAPKAGKPPGYVEITARSRVAPLLLRLKWLDWPLFHSREHGWTFRVSPKGASTFKTPLKPLIFTEEADERLQLDSRRGYTFYKLPHKDGEKANVGSPFGKTFVKHAEQGTLTSPGGEANEALSMNAQCSYWISARDRVMKQMVVWDGSGGSRMGFPSSRPSAVDDVNLAKEGQKWGMILPQVITMGTVTRRAIENTWLTASNAKRNRVGSELKAMVRAPPGQAIVGADVDSEELWISSLLGDAQFGLHGASALGWMTLEGQKKYETDLHSKTAKILGVSRDQAKVFNYSRIYGAGKRHASLLLRQSNPNMTAEEGNKLADALYANTKGNKTRKADSLIGRQFWYGGTESFVFNKLEEIALSDRPKTPALGCSITLALRKEYLPEVFGKDYMPSRINWVVQSSGVDYLHLLIVSMEHLISTYDIKARYLISVHDELRYLVTEEDKYRCALALQIANLWTRSLFAWKLGLDDLPQGVAFFSAVDVDRVLRKEVDLPCITPSQPTPIPPGEALDMGQILEKTEGGSLGPVKNPFRGNESMDEGYSEPNCLVHRAKSPAYLKVQATTELGEIKFLSKMSSSGKKAPATPKKSAPLVKKSPSKVKKPAKPLEKDDEWDDIVESEQRYAARRSQA
ncbi:DNA-directed DNA polymerase gamma mip1 [Tulasnella sp. 427]|nr:DNA-directed DNA polymerase gamma mip1 [Tulasnella sp. 427]